MFYRVGAKTACKHNISCFNLGYVTAAVTQRTKETRIVQVGIVPRIESFPNNSRINVNQR